MTKLLERWTQSAVLRKIPADRLTPLFNLPINPWP